MNPLIQNLIEAACCAKVVEIVRQFNHKMLQLRQKFCQIVTFIVLRSEKCTFCNTACSMFCFDLSIDTEKYQHNNKNSFKNSDWLFMSICATRAHFQPQNLAEMIHICLIFDTILRKHLTISTTLALLNLHADSNN